MKASMPKGPLTEFLAMSLEFVGPEESCKILFGLPGAKRCGTFHGS